MRIRPTDSGPNTSFWSGFVSAIVLLTALAGMAHLYEWLQRTSLNGIVAWWTTERTITFVPIRTVQGLFGIGLIILILSVIILYTGLSRRGTHD